MLGQLSVKTRLILLVSIPVLVLIAALVLSLQEMQRLSQGVNTVYQSRVVPLQQIKLVSDNYAVTSVDVLHKFRAGLLTEPQVLQALQEAQKVAAEAWRSYSQSHLSDEEQALVRQVTAYQQPFLALLQQLEQQIRDGSVSQIAAADFNQQLYNAADPLSLALDELIMIQLVETEKFRNALELDFEDFVTFYLIASALIISLLLVLALLVYHSIQNPLLLLQKTISAVEQNLDLRLRFNAQGQDEIASAGRAFDAMLSRFQSFFGGLSLEIQQINTASDQMSDISALVRHTTEDQELQVNSVATAVTEMAAAIQEVAASALLTSDSANEVDTRAQFGHQTIHQNMQAIQGLSASLNNASAVISVLNDESEKISQVLDVIRSIAEQTNLLALNAAIEAARAGDAGRGFAVVADEVRQLAINTQKATESIRAMIGNLQGSARQAVEAMSDSSQHASSSVGHAEQSAAIMDEIKNLVASIVDMNIQISAATEQQSAVSEDISRNINQFSASVAEVADSARHCSDTSAMLQTMATKLKQQSAEFKI